MEHIHSICLLNGNPDGSYPALYYKIEKYVAEDYAVIYTVEPDVNQVVRRMRQHGIEVETMVESGSLTLVDRNAMYSAERTRFDGHALLDSWHSVILQVRKRSQARGILAIGSGENFFQAPSAREGERYRKKLVAYEQMVGKKFYIPFEAICCYDPKSLARLPLADLARLLDSHQSTVHAGCCYDEINPARIAEMVGKGMDRALGEGTSALLFEAIKTMYGIDGDDIASKPELLEGMLSRLLGRDAAKCTLEATCEDIARQSTFDRQR